MVYKIDCHLEPSLIRYPLVFATTYDDSVFKLAFSCYVGEFTSSEFKHYFLFATLRVHGTKDTKTEVIDDFVESIDKIYGSTLSDAEKDNIRNDITKYLKGKI